MEQESESSNTQPTIVSDSFLCLMFTEDVDTSETAGDKVLIVGFAALWLILAWGTNEGNSSQYVTILRSLGGVVITSSRAIFNALPSS